MRKKANRKAPKRKTFGKSKLGSGGRFKKCVETMEKRPDVDDPEGLCAAIGRRAYGKRKFQRMAAGGRNPGASQGTPEGSPASASMLQTLTGHQPEILVAESFTYNKNMQRGGYAANITATDIEGPYTVMVTGPGIAAEHAEFQSSEAAEYYAHHRLDELLPVGAGRELEAENPAYAQVRGRGWMQESYETASRDAGRRTRQLKKLGYRAISAPLGPQVTPVGIVKLTMVNIGPGTTGDEYLEDVPPPAGGVVRLGNPGIIEPIIAGASAGTAVALTNRALKNPPPDRTIVDADQRIVIAPSQTHPGQWDVWVSGIRRYVKKTKRGAIGAAKRVAKNPDAYPDSERDAARFFEKFHGRPAEEIVTVPEDEHYHEYLGGIGDLVEIKVKTKSGYKVDLDFAGDNVMVAASEDGRQLYLTGGNQKLDLKSLHMDGKPWRKDLMNIGAIEELTYRTEKSFDENETTDYYHKLSEVTKGPMPDLLYDTLNDRLQIAGGQYHIPLPMIGVSPGIVN